MTWRRLSKWTIALAIAALISVVSIAGTRIWVWLQPPPGPPAPLTAGLKGDWAQVSAEVDRRLKTKFPIGSSEDALIAELRREGFAKQDWRAVVDSEHEARREESVFICNTAAYAFWRADASGVLTAVRGEYREEGCL